MIRRAMDSASARLLAARIASGVRVGTVIELTGDAGDLHAGDRGTVRGYSSTGGFVVAWERGFELEIDPTTTRFLAMQG
jgi:hypothetical protein